MDFGACCACGGVEHVRNFIALNLKAPVPGTGWGCVVCGLAADGALTIVCDACLAAGTKPQLAIKGYPAGKQRVPISELQGKYEHDLRFHRELIVQ